jgi:uncharacterized protein
MVDVLKIGVVLAGMIALIRLKVALSIIMMICSLAMGLLFRISTDGLLNGVVEAFLSSENLKLVLALELVLLFSAVLKEYGALQRAISALNGLIRDTRFTVAMIPAIIGLLPVVGGAMLSAPLVAEASDELKLPPERRTFLNFWFRHVWEYSLPTFPAVFLTAGITGVPIPELAAAGIPLTLAAIAAGVIFGFRGVRLSPRSKVEASLRQTMKQMADFIWSLLPFLLVITLTIGLDIHLVYPLACVTAAVILLHRMPLSSLLQLMRRHLSIDLAFLIWGIMLFKEILLATQAMTHIAAELAEMGIPALALVVFLPAVIAFITGYTTAFVGLSFPVLLPFIQPGGLTPYYVILALASGICAHLLSPMHACLVMTIQYYEAGMGKTYRLLFLPTVSIFLTAGFIFTAAYWLSR